MRSISVALPVFFFLFVGCTPTEPKPVATKGIVKTKAGRACDGALVVFHPLEQERQNDAKPVAKTDQDGRFVLTTFAENDGALPGDYSVTIVWPAQDAKGSKLSLTGEGGGNGPDQLKGKFGNPGKPLLKAKIVNQGANEIELEVD